MRTTPARPATPPHRHSCRVGVRSDGDRRRAGRSARVRGGTGGDRSAGIPAGPSRRQLRIDNRFVLDGLLSADPPPVSFRADVLLGDRLHQQLLAAGYQPGTYHEGSAVKRKLWKRFDTQPS